MRPNNGRQSHYSWRGDGLHYDNSSSPVATIVRDETYPTMWRVCIGDHVSDMLNRARAKETAFALAERFVGRPQSYGSRAHRKPTGLIPAEAPSLVSSEPITATVALSRHEMETFLWVLDVDEETLSRMTDEQVRETAPYGAAD